MLADDLIVGAKAAAQFTGLTERQVYHMSAEGSLPCIRRGKRLFFRKSELEQSLRSDAAPAPAVRQKPNRFTVFDAL